MIRGTIYYICLLYLLVKYAPFLGIPVVFYVSRSYYNMAFKFWDRYRRTKFLEPFNRHPTDGHTKIIGFFHPYCNAGGGGERVLWTAVAAMQRSNPNLVCAIYSGDTDATKDDIIAKVQSRFAITLDSRALGFVFLQSRYLVEDTTWPRFTLLGQSVGSMLLALEAMLYLRPDLYIDTMGYAFTYPIFKIFGGVTCGAYVHYPTISTDMLARVESRRNWHTNSSWISSSPILTQGKLLYYRIFMHFYAVSLRQASFVMANSTWTKNHVDSILKHNDRFMSILLFPFFLTLALLPGSRKSTAADYALRVYPPCDTTEMAKYPLEGREPIIISVAQFRPEKDHPAQLRALYELFDAHPEYRETVRLILIGGSRNAEDAARVELLRTLAAKLGIQDSIEFRINAPYPDMLEMLGRSSIGLSTMVDEHFGINVVEYMAAGVIPLAHASAGPLLDIVTPWEGQPTGFHATTPQEYAEKLHHILTLPPDEDLAMRERARTAALSRFSEAEFVRRWDMSGWQKWLEAE